MRRWMKLTSENVIELSDVTKIFQVKKSVFNSIPFVALDHINLNIRKGEIIGLVGASGSGKTTIARILTMLYSVTSGKIVFNGEDVTNLTNREIKDYRKKVQMVFQDPYSSLDPNHSVFWHVQRPLKLSKYHGDIEGRVKELLSSVGLNPPEAFFDRLPYQLSGGQRQRVYLARSLAPEPELLIADEPVSNLDASIKASILDLLKRISEDLGLSILYISHDIATVWYISKRINVINKGKIIETNSSDVIVDNPTQDYTKLLIDSTPDPFKRLE